MERFDETAHVTVQELLDAGPDDIGKHLNHLCSLIWCGESPLVLVPLIESDRVDLVTGAAYILSEIGAKGAPLVEHVPTLAKHPSRRVRAYIVDYIAQLGPAFSDQVVDSVHQLLTDSDQGVAGYAFEVFSKSRILKGPA